MKPSDHLLVELLRCALGVRPRVAVLYVVSGEDWRRTIDMAFTHGVAALAADGYHKIMSVNPGVSTAIESEEMEDLRYEWLGGVLQAEDEFRYKLMKASRFARALAEKGVECKVLKGMAFATYYKRPDHRECGDCDVYLGDGYELGNQVAAEMGAKYERGTYKHSHLFFGNLMIENHRYLTDFHGTEQGKKIERLLERVISETPASGTKRIGKTDLLCPNDHFNALFLIKHAHGNFMYEGLTLRMLFDWASLLKCCQDRLDWTRVNEDLEICRLREFASVMTSICVDYLGLKLTNGNVETCKDKRLVNEVITDTLSCGIYTEGKETFFRKCIRIFRRFLRIWHYRALATESFPRMIWNNFAFSSYMKREIEM